MRVNPLCALLVFAACGDDTTTPMRDAATVDTAMVTDGFTSDGQMAGVLCNDEATMCSVPDQVCCDVTSGTDNCVAANATCAETRMACDGPEDCMANQECCLFSDRSQCMDDGICGTTGSISEVMCHDMTHCESGEMCCGTAPGPLLDLYFVCRAGFCPQ